MDKGTCATVSTICTKAYDQLGPFLANNISFCADSLWVGRWAWWECTYMAIKPKTHSHPMAKLGAIRTNAISHWGFTTFPQAPAWEMAVTCVCMIVHIQNHVINGQNQAIPIWVWWMCPIGHICREEQEMTHVITVCNGLKKNQLVSKW